MFRTLAIGCVSLAFPYAEAQAYHARTHAAGQEHEHGEVDETVTTETNVQLDDDHQDTQIEERVAVNEAVRVRYVEEFMEHGDAEDPRPHIHRYRIEERVVTYDLYGRDDEPTPVTPVEPETEPEPETEDPETEPEPPTPQPDPTPVDPPTPPPGPVTPIQTNSETGEMLACHIIARDFTVFDLHSLDKEDGSAYSQSGVAWKFCQYLAGKDYFAQYTDPEKDLTGSDYLPSAAYILRDDNDDIAGIQIVRESEDVCQGETNYAFTANIHCSADIKEKGQGRIVGVDLDDPCHPVVAVEHEAGCALITASPLFTWLSENPLVLSIICLLLGPLLCLFGNAYFPFIGACLGAGTMINLILFISGFMGWMGTTTNVYICVALAILVGVLFGILIAKNIKVVLVLNSLVFGLVFGMFAYGLIAYFFEWYQWWGLVAISLTTMILGGVIACRHAVGLVIAGTAFLGAWLFTSGLRAIVEDDYMTEFDLAKKLHNGEPIDFNGDMWFFLIFFVIVMLFSLVWQNKMHEMKEKEHWDGKHVWEREHTIVQDDYEQMQ